MQHLIRVDNLAKGQLLAYLNCFTKYCLKRLKNQSSLNGLQDDALVNDIDDIVDEEDGQENAVKFEAYTDFEVLSW